MRPPSRRFGPIIAIAACIALGACAAVLQMAAPAPPKLYSLTPKSTFEDDLPRVHARLSVEVPAATAGLNTARIALRPTPTTLDYYADASWIDVVPVMVQNLLFESFDNTGKLDMIGREAVDVRADYALLTFIREFQADYDGNGRPNVRVRLQGQLIRLPRRTPVASTSEEFSVQAEDPSLPAIVRAFDEAFGKAAKRLVEWTIRQMALAQTPRS